MLINAATFSEKRKSKRPAMALATVARKAGVSERTLARIKNKEEMNASTVEKIAKALDMTVEELCSAPKSKRDYDRGGVDGMHIELAAARYRVAPELIEWLAPMMFVAFAELALKQRKNRLESWWTKVEELQKVQPKFNIDSIAKMDAESGITALTDAYWSEMAEIEEHSLDGWADEYNDHFFSALFSVYDKFDFEGFLPSETTPFAYGGYKYDGNFSDGKFPYPRESLKGFEGGYMYPEVFYETVRELAGSNINFYDPLGESPEFFDEHPISRMAEEKLQSGFVPLSRMPIELRGDEKAFERAEWIASCDGKEQIPEVFYHWEAVCRISSCRYYENQSRELADQLQGATPEERAAIEDELQAAREKSAAWMALIMPNDEEWNGKWTAHWEVQDSASVEEEAK